MSTFPVSLQTASVAEGHALALRLAEAALAERRTARTTMADHLSAGAAPSVEALTAAYFQAVAVVNYGWPVR